MSTTRTISLRASGHAALRWLQRIDSDTYSPRARIREAVGRGEEINLEGIDNTAIYDDETGALLVLNGDEILTCWRRGEDV